MKLINANVGDILKRCENDVRITVTIVSVHRDRNFVTYRRHGEPDRVYTATATRDDTGSSPPRRAASDWTLV